MSYKDEMAQHGNHFDGCAGLEDVQSFEEWIDFEARLRAKYKDGRISKVWMNWKVDYLMNQIILILA